MVTKDVIRYVQRRLTELGFDPGPVDGDYGPRTLAALGRVDGIPDNFSKRRKLIAFIQLEATAREIEAGSVDGYWGPQTDFAWEQLEHIEATGAPEPDWRPESQPKTNPNGWPSQATDAELIAFFGEPGENLTHLTLPYRHRLSWNTRQSVSRMTCNRRVHDSLGRVLQNVLEIYGENGIHELRLDLWGGTFNKRRMRGGSRWSMHSWGIALDYDPTRNQLRWGRDRAHFARSDYDDWWRCWEAEGWVSLGRQRNFDWMHVQAATL
jgi:hypothetical protein